MRRQCKKSLVVPGHHLRDLDFLTAQKMGLSQFVLNGSDGMCWGRNASWEELSVTKQVMELREVCVSRLQHAPIKTCSFGLV